MTISPLLYKALSELDPTERCAYLLIGGQYWDYLGIAEDLTPRLYLRKRPPYWRTVKALQDDYTWADRTAPGGLHPLTTALLIAAPVVFFAARALAGGGAGWAPSGAALAVLLAALATACFPPSRYFDAYDRWAEVPLQSYGDSRAETERKAAAHKAQQMQLAMWTELHGINQAVNPHQSHTVPPYGSMPPL